MFTRNERTSQAARILLVALIALQAVGCANVQKKFIRKKKEPDRRPAIMYVEEGPYQKKFSNDYYYKTHFTMWKTWHSELLTRLGDNHKKVVRCAQESYGQLVEMARYLDAEKAAELSDEIAEMRRIMTRIESGSYSSSEEASFRVDLERLYRVVGNNFYYNKVKDSVLPDRVDLGPSGGASAAPAV